MIKRKLHRLKSSQGFTLIELLVVVIIIGILSSIAVVGISGARKSAYVGQCTANASQLVKAIVAYKAANNLYPGETTLLPFSGDRTFTLTDITLLTAVGSSFLSNILPYVGATSGSPYYLQASLTFATGGVTVTSSTTTTAAVPLVPYAGCANATIG